MGVFMLICLSASHKNASLPLLESLIIKNEAAVAKALCLEGIAKECVMLQTCNRIEIYCKFPSLDKDNAEKQVMKVWSTVTGVSFDIIIKLVKLYYDRDVMEHLFFLASGLESMVIGEDQILGQVRSAFYKARELGTSGPILDRVFMKAISIGRRVRTETRINEGSVSIGSAAVDLAGSELGDLTSKKVLIIGAGEIGKLVVDALKTRNAAITITNRTFERGQILAERTASKVIPFAEVFNAVPNADLVITAISVTAPFLTEHNLSSITAGRLEPKRTLIIDISQPRAVEEEVDNLQGFRLKTLDDLKRIVAHNLKQRETEAEKTKAIIFAELSRFEESLSQLVVQPLINDICRRYEQIRQRELTRAICKMNGLDEKKLAVLDRFSKELIERIAQIPIQQLRKAALGGDNELLSVADRLFNAEA